jgi:uncharacterized protein
VAPRHEIRVRPEQLAIVRLDTAAALPEWALSGSGLAAVVRRDAELSIVREAAGIPDGLTVDRGWRALELRGPFELTMTGVLASIAVPLAEAGVAIFALATYDTDLVLVRESQLDQARQALEAAGHAVVTAGR